MADLEKLDIEVDGVNEPWGIALTRLVSPWNAAGVPAGTVPGGRDRYSAPVGIQVIGPWFAESRVIQVMQQIEDLVGGAWPPTEFDPFAVLEET